MLHRNHAFGLMPFERMHLNQTIRALCSVLPDGHKFNIIYCFFSQILTVSPVDLQVYFIVVHF